MNRAHPGAFTSRVRDYVARRLHSHATCASTTITLRTGRCSLAVPPPAVLPRAYEILLLNDSSTKARARYTRSIGGRGARGLCTCRYRNRATRHEARHPVQQPGAASPVRTGMGVAPTSSAPQPCAATCRDPRVFISSRRRVPAAHGRAKGGRAPRLGRRAARPVLRLARDL